GALLEQLKRQQTWLKNKHIDLRVCGVANSKALLTNVHGLNLDAPFAATSAMEVPPVPTIGVFISTAAAKTAWFAFTGSALITTI
ncbi:hypothetical protein MJN85_30980, partial [Salmonella enterica subsp. enterica serovar Anatum]|nr:hypothetical protein [Salmonella enterica subsp. enterica serovar Anatum]